MNRSEVERIAALVAERNAIDAEIGRITGRPVVAGHLGEWIASQIFDIALEHSAAAKDIDGHFASGPLAGRSVNVKWYGKQDGTLNLKEAAEADYYLVMTGPKGAAISSRGAARPLSISAVYLFSMPELIAALRERGVRIGIATSVRVADWADAEIYPRRRNRTLPLSDE